MRKSKNLYKYVAVEIYLAGASEQDCLNNIGAETAGHEVSIGFGRSPKQAKANAISKYIGNCDLTPILGDYGVFLNGKSITKEDRYNHLISNTGEVLVKH